MEQRLLIADHNAELCEHDHSDQSGVTTIVQFAAPLTRPTREYPSSENCAPRETVPLPTQGLEDQHLAQRVERALCATGFGALCTVRVTISARVVILGGRVSSYYLKQVAQSTALAVPGAHQIRNDLHVFKPKWDRHNT